MAEERKSAKRYWPVMLMAIALAETAHAPLMKGAVASEQPSKTQSKATAAPSSLAKADKKSELASATTGVPDSSAQSDESQSTLQKKDLLAALPLPPNSTVATYPEIEGALADPISLLHTDAANASGVTAGASVSGTDPVLGESTPPPNGTTASTSPVVEPILADPVAPADPQDPVVGSPATPVPEPSCLAIALGGFLLLGRRTSRA